MDAKFRENKPFAKWRNRLLMLINHALVSNFNVAYMSFNAIREKNIFPKIPEFTVISLNKGLNLGANVFLNLLNLY